MWVLRNKETDEGDENVRNHPEDNDYTSVYCNLVTASNNKTFGCAPWLKAKRAWRNMRKCTVVAFVGVRVCVIACMCVRIPACGCDSMSVFAVSVCWTYTVGVWGGASACMHMLAVFIEDSSASVTGSLKDARLAGPQHPLPPVVKDLGSAHGPFYPPLRPSMFLSFRFADFLFKRTILSHLLPRLQISYYTKFSCMFL